MDEKLFLSLHHDITWRAAEQWSPLPRSTPYAKILKIFFLILTGSSFEEEPVFNLYLQLFLQDHFFGLLTFIG